MSKTTSPDEISWYMDKFMQLGEVFIGDATTKEGVLKTLVALAAFEEFVRNTRDISGEELDRSREVGAEIGAAYARRARRTTGN